MTAMGVNMVTFEEISSGKAAIAVVGLGYVGLRLAAAFGRKARVIGLEISEKRTGELKEGFDSTGEVSPEELASTRIEYTTDSDRLGDARFIVVTVPTPIDASHQPDLRPVQNSSRSIGKHIKAGSIVVLESTVYPGVTEEVAAPIIARESGLICGVDFKMGYSPERINPGDKVHTVETIVKVVSGQDAETLETVAQVYGMIVEAGIHRAESIKVAEAAKMIENTQRDVNIALMNELAIIFGKMGIPTGAVLEAAGTKWNFLKFTPGLVGGHCIGVDPYYLTFKAELVGYRPEVILAGRRINDSMGKYVAEHAVKQMIRAGKAIHGSRVLVLGLTYKENVRDIRNSKVVDIVAELREYGVEVLVHDPLADPEETRLKYGIGLSELDSLGKVDAVVLAVPHSDYKTMTVPRLKELCSNGNSRGVVIDVKGMVTREEVEASGLLYLGLM